LAARPGLQPGLQQLNQTGANIQGPSPRERLRPGPKPKPLAARPYRPWGPIQRIRRSYSKARKVEVLLFLLHHRVAVEGTAQSQFHPPTKLETSHYWKIPEPTIQLWWVKRDEILQLPSTARRALPGTWTCLWPAMEEELFAIFLAEQQKGRLIRRGWFRTQAKELFTKHYSASANMFVFSAGWFNGFLKRWSISCRALTKMSSRLPEKYELLVVNWLRFNRRNSQPRNFFERCQITSDIGRFRLSNILNLDETPIPFEYLDGRTYDLKGSKTISGKTDRSGWDKRQATLILYIFADGIARIKPKIIFHGKSSDRGTIRRKEEHHWHPGVTVEINETAYNNEELFLQFIDEELIPALQKAPGTIPDNARESLLLMDVAGFHTTPQVLQKLRSASITTSLIPSGCTGLLQPLDTAVNKPFKQYLREYTDAYTLGKQSSIQKWSTSDKRIMVIHVVGEAWAHFQQEKKDLITKAFRDVGVTLPVDGSQDQDIHIKGFDNIAVGDWDSDILLPAAHRPSESYRPLPTENSNHDALEIFWTCEDYTHHPIDGSSVQPTAPGPAGGTLLQF